MTDPTLATEISQFAALERIPSDDMLVDPHELRAALEEPSDDGALSPVALMAWTVASLALTVLAAIWWVAAYH